MPRKVEDRAADLHPAVGIRVGAEFFHVGTGREDHVGELGGLGEKDVLDGEEVELREGLAHLVDVRIREEGILAHDVHAFDAALEGGVHDLHHREARVRGQLLPPGFFEFLADGWVLNGLVIGVDHGDQAGIAGALHVVLAAQGMQPGACFAHVPRHQGQGDEAAGIVGAVGMLGDAHAPVDDGVLRRAEGLGDQANRFGVHAADLCDAFGRVVRHARFEGFKIFRVLGHIVFVHQTLGQDGVHHGVVESDVSARFDAAVEIRLFGHLPPARVDHDDLCTRALGLLEEGGGHRVIRRGIGARDEQHLGVERIAIGGGDGAAPDALE